MLAKEINTISEVNDQAANLRKLVKNLEQKGQNEPQTTISGEAKKHTRIIAITSGKGGVGKTSISVNLALALAKLNKRVILFDADLGLANINVLVGVIPKYNIYHVVKGHKNIKDILITTPEGVDIIAGASGYSMLANLPNKDREHLMQEFMSLEGYDFMIIDTGAGVSENVVGFATHADEVLILTTPEPTAITDAYGMIKSIVLAQPEKSIKLVVNRAGSSLEAKKVAEKVSNITKQFLHAEIQSGGFIFDDEHVGKSVRRQKPFVIQYPSSKASSCVKVIASRLSHLDASFPEGEGGLGRFFKKIFSPTDEVL